MAPTSSFTLIVAGCPMVTRLPVEEKCESPRPPRRVRRSRVARLRRHTCRWPRLGVESHARSFVDEFDGDAGHDGSSPHPLRYRARGKWCPGRKPFRRHTATQLSKPLFFAYRKRISEKGGEDNSKKHGSKRTHAIDNFVSVFGREPVFPIGHFDVDPLHGRNQDKDLRPNAHPITTSMVSISKPKNCALVVK